MIDPPFHPDTICARCLVDHDLRKWVRNRATATACDVCGRVSFKPIAADFPEFLDHVIECIASEYEDASMMVPYEDGEYVFSGHSSAELLWEIPEISEDQRVVDAIAHAMPDNYWVEKNIFSLSPYDALRLGWEEFARMIKHETRFLFFPQTPARAAYDDPSEVRPEEMLVALDRLLRSERLVKRLPSGTKLYRVRAHAANETPTTAAELGPPPSDRVVQSNRMSPAGISMLYAAGDADTAIAETLTANTTHPQGTLAVFELHEELRIVDFARLPQARSIFSSDSTPHTRAPLQFLNALARSIALPIERDGREHVEYVPTQVVTEYLRYRFRPERPVHGVRYRSSKRDDGVNFALFLSADDLVSISSWRKPPFQLQLLEHSPVSLNGSA